MYQSRQIKKLLSVGDVVYSAQGGARDGDQRDLR